MVKYHLYAIRPIPSSAVEIGQGAGPLLLDSAHVDNVEYHINGNDGVHSTWFEPKLDQSDVFLERLWHQNDDWGKTDEFYLKEGICFVAGWRTETAASTEPDSDGDGHPDSHDKPDFQPVYTRMHVDSVTETSVKVTLFVELRNLGQPREPYYGGVEVRWRHAEGIGSPKKNAAPPGQGSGPQVAANPLFPNVVTETATYSGQSTLYLENSWMLSREEWEASDGFTHPFTFTIEVDPDDDVDELNESNNLCEITLGSWSEETGFLAAESQILQIHLSSQIRNRIGLVRLRSWRVHPVDPSILGDSSFIAFEVSQSDLAEVTSILADADLDDLFVVIVAGTGVALVDVMH